MNRILYSLLLTTFLLCGWTAWGQTISVANFQFLETDVTANLHGTTVYDQNGEKCALIKIYTNQTGFLFDVGMLGVMKTEQKVGEIWVYVPFGVKKMTISHALWKRCEFYFPIAIEKARTYSMELNVDGLKEKEDKPIPMQYVLFEVHPEQALVEFDGDTLEKVNNMYSVRKPFGTYRYRIHAPLHEVIEDSMTIDNPNMPYILKRSLQRTSAYCELSIPENSPIYVNGDLKGYGHCQLELAFGDYVFESRKDRHIPTAKHLTVSQDSTHYRLTLEAPRPIYGSLGFFSKTDSVMVVIDGQKKGYTPLFIEKQLIGNTEVSLSKPGYKTVTDSIMVFQGMTGSYAVQLQKESSPNASVMQEQELDWEKLRRRASYEYLPKSSFYLEARLRPSLDFNQILSCGATMGGYIKGVNLEGFVDIGLTSSYDPLYAYHASEMVGYSFTHRSLLSLGGSLGYGIKIGRRIRLTPQVSVAYLIGQYEQQKHDSFGRSSLCDYNCLQLLPGGRLEVGLLRALTLVARGAYAFRLLTSPEIGQYSHLGLIDFAEGPQASLGLALTF